MRMIAGSVLTIESVIVIGRSSMRVLVPIGGQRQNVSPPHRACALLCDEPISLGRRRKRPQVLAHRTANGITLCIGGTRPRKKFAAPAQVGHPCRSTLSNRPA